MRIFADDRKIFLDGGDYLEIWFSAYRGQTISPSVQSFNEMIL